MRKTPRIRVQAGRAVVVTGSGLFAALIAGCGLGQQAANPPPVGTSGAPVAIVGGSPDTSVPGPAAPVSNAASPVPTGSPRCRSADLTLTIEGGEGATGHVYRMLRFTNHSDHTCVIQGYPGVSYVAGDDGHEVGPAAVRDGDIGPQIELRPGGSAVADVGFTDVGLFDPAVCQPTPVRGLRVYPPDERAALYLPLPGTGCAGTTPSPQLHIRTTTAA